MFCAAYHSVVIFFSIFFISDVILNDGRTEDLLIISTIAASTGVFTLVGKAAVATRHWVWPHHVAYWLSYIALFGLLLIESSLLDLFPDFYQIMNIAMSLPYFWLMIVIVFAICIIPEISYEYLQRAMCPYDWQIVQEKYIELNGEDAYIDEDFEDAKKHSVIPPSNLPTRDTNSSTRISSVMFKIDERKDTEEIDENEDEDPTTDIRLDDKGKKHLESSSERSGSAEKSGSEKIGSDKSGSEKSEKDVNIDSDVSGGKESG